MKLSKILTLVTLCAIAFSCERSLLQDDAELHTLTGRLVQSCENTNGVAGVQLSLFLDENNIKGKGKRIAEAITDDKGNFTLTYEGGIEANIYLETFPATNRSPKMLMMGIPWNQSLDLGLIYNTGQAVEMTLICRTDYSFSENDTLKMGHAAAVPGDNGLLTHRRIVGPFTDGQVLAVIETPGTVQSFSDSLYADYRLMDPDFVPYIGYFFKSKYPDDARYSMYLTTPCEPSTLEIRLDSTMLRP